MIHASHVAGAIELAGQDIQRLQQLLAGINAACRKSIDELQVRNLAPLFGIVVQPEGSAITEGYYTGDGIMVNSGQFEGYPAGKGSVGIAKGLSDDRART